MASSNSQNLSAFVQSGIEDTISNLVLRTQQLYLADEIPWVVGYSGGKDSTATLQVVWNAINGLPRSKRHKPVYVISTDTLVENPIVALWVQRSLSAMDKAIAEQGLPFSTHRLVPEVQDRFWVNLIGKGYPAPRPKFRWCTSRLKINPSNRFINEVVSKNGEAILVLGTRSAESAKRSAQMKRNANSSRENLSRVADKALDRVWMYPPIADWSNDDVWEYLVTYANPWGFDNSELLGMYRGATKDNECPLVVDSSTPSCGDSRFGCYVCTMVDKDKSMEAMIQNDEEKRWMMPLVEIRNGSLSTDDRDRRDFRRINGALTAFNGRLVHGPYKQEFREHLLRQVLEAQQNVREIGPPEVRNMQLLSQDDLEEIRRIWVTEKHEIEDRVPAIYEEVFGEPYPGPRVEEGQPFSADDLAVLREVCIQQGDPEGVHYQALREMLHIEQKFRGMARRVGLFDALEGALDRALFETAEEAQEFALERDHGRNLGSDDGRVGVVPPETLTLKLESV